MAERDDLDQPDGAEFGVVHVAEFSLPDEIVEDLAPREDPVTALELSKNELRRWVVGGVGALIALAMVLAFVLVLFRPSLVEFAGQFLQLVVGGLVGLAGSVVGFLFGRDQM